MNTNSIRFPLAALALFAASVTVQAQETAAAPAYTISANVGLFSQYIFRGISYTQEKPAVQGGFDLAHESGAYLGVWGTNVSDLALSNATGEIDVYGGFAKTIDDWTVDVGFLQFIFPGGKYDPSGESLNTLELNAAVTWKFIQLKYSYAVTDYFGFSKKAFGADSDGSDYIELNANYEFMPSWVLNAHVGHQKVKNYDDYDFTDWRVGVTKNFEGGWQAAVAYVDTNADKNFYTICDTAGGVQTRCKDTGDSKWLVYVKRTF